MTWVQVHPRRYITLIELLIVIAIISAVLAVVGLNIGGAVRAERFRASAGRVVDHLRLAQDLMLIVNTSVRVKLKQEPEGLSVRLHVEGALTPALDKATKDVMIIPNLRAFQFTDTEGQTFTGEAELNFLSGGSRMSRGVLILGELGIDPRSGMTETIILSGHPETIRTASQDPDGVLDQERWQEQSATLYPQEVVEEARRRHENNTQKTRPSS